MWGCSGESQKNFKEVIFPRRPPAIHPMLRSRPKFESCEKGSSFLARWTLKCTAHFFGSSHQDSTLPNLHISLSNPKIKVTIAKL